MIRVFPVRARPNAPREMAPGRERPCPARVSYVDTHNVARREHKHEAQDIFAPTGSAVLAPEDVRVLGIGSSPRGGFWVRLYSEQSDRTYYMAHLATRAHVDADELVDAGQVVGLVGRTGNASSTCSHLHLRVSRGADRRLGSGEWKRTGPALNVYPELRAVDPHEGGVPTKGRPPHPFSRR